MASTRRGFLGSISGLFALAAGTESGGMDDPLPMTPAEIRAICFEVDARIRNATPREIQRSLTAWEKVNQHHKKGHHNALEERDRFPECIPSYNPHG